MASLAAEATDDLEAEADELRPEVLEARLREVENSISHLHRSNKELAEALAEVNGEDPDFRQAINENVVIILRREEDASELRKCIELARDMEARASLKDAASEVLAAGLDSMDALGGVEVGTVGPTPSEAAGWGSFAGPLGDGLSSGGQQEAQPASAPSTGEAPPGELDPTDGGLFL